MNNNIKYILLIISLVLTTANNLNANITDISVVGNVYVGTKNSSIPMGNITVELKSINYDIAQTYPISGYFRLNVPFEQSFNKTIVLIFKVGDIILHEQPIHITKDDIGTYGKLKRQGLRYIYKAGGINIIDDPVRVTKLIKKRIRNPHEENKSTLGLETAGSSPGILSYFLLLLGGPLAPPGDYERIETSLIPIDSYTFSRQPIDLQVERFRTIEHSGIGFRYSPVTPSNISLITNSSSAAMWPGLIINLSSSPFCEPGHDLNLSSNYTTSNGLMFGASFYISWINDKVTATYDSNMSESKSFKVYEQTLLLAIGKRIFDFWSIAGNSRIEFYEGSTPEYIKRVKKYGYEASSDVEVLLRTDDEIILSTYTNECIYFDISTTIDLSPRVQIGLSSINAFIIPLSKHNNSQRSGIGIGSTVYFDLFRAGFDVDIYENNSFNWSTGISVPLTNNFDILLSYSSYENMFHAGLRLRSFIISTRFNNEEWQLASRASIYLK